jgi:hypothetical protein
MIHHVRRLSPSHLRALLCALLLAAAMPKRLSAEDFFDLKGSFYAEDRGRVEVWSPTWMWQTEVTPHTTLRIQGVYDVISGATPTGEPPRRRTREQVVEVKSSSSSSVTTYQTISGPSGHIGGVIPVTQQITSTTTTKQTIQVPYGKPFLPTIDFSDERLALSAELEHHWGDWIGTASLFYGNESDYHSRSASLKLGRELNNKNTLLSLGASFTDDEVLTRELTVWDGKTSIEGILSISQVLDVRTLLQAGYTFGNASGFLNDQYKRVLINDNVVLEQRPDNRDKHVLFLALSRYSDALHGAAELSYRFYHDTFGIDAHTVELAWRQNIGRHIVLVPSLRYYQQSAADFYGVQFTGKPSHYSADYRLSKLASLTPGVQVVWKVTDNLTFDAAYRRYSMWGRDGTTSDEAYPDANVFSVGLKLCY